MATKSTRGKAAKDVDKKASKKVEEEVIHIETPAPEIAEPEPTPVIDENVIESTPLPPEPEPEPVYEEPILTQLIVECYEGCKARGLYDGYGIACFVGGHRYEGEFSEGLMHGCGKYTWADGVVYEGEFTNNQITGRGKYIWADGSTYEGDVCNGMRHGVGIFCCPVRKIIYNGDWVMGKQTGKGRLQYDPEGCSYYDGQWVCNIRHGYGTRCYQSGNIYQGTWYNNNRHGNGTMQWFDKNQSYSGNWENGVQHGMGQQVWYLRRGATTQYSLRNMYVGELCQGMRHGCGTFYYANGARYEGEWKYNVKCGKGKFVFKNGRVYEGQFEDDHIVEFPTFQMDGLTTPDMTKIRTRTPLPYERNGSSHGNESVNTYSPSFRLDVEHLLQELVDADREDEISQVTFVVMRHMTSLHRVYLFYSRLGHDDNPDNTFVMTRMQFWRFIKDCRLHHTDYGLSDMDRWLARTPARFAEMHNPYGQLLFREFLDYLIVLAYHLYCSQHTSGPLLAWCMSRLITENILKYACIVQGQLYMETCQTANALVHMDQLFDIYRCLCSPSKCQPMDSVLTMRQFMFALKDMKLINQDLSAKAFICILATDDPKVVDCQGGINMELEIVFLEFFEALLQCSQVCVTQTIVDSLQTVLKLDSVAGSHHSSPPTNSANKMSAHSVHDSRQTLSASGQKLDNIDVSSKSVVLDPNSAPEDALYMQPNLDAEQKEILRSSLLITSIEPESRATLTAASDVDPATQQFNLWTHRVHTFIAHKFIPAAHLHLEVQTRLAAERQRRRVCIGIEPCQQLETVGC